MNLDRLGKTVEKAFAHYELAQERCRKTISREHPIGLWSLNYKAGHRAGRYLNLRRKLESLGGRFRNLSPLKPIVSR